MDSSSNDSFAWTTASSDYSDTDSMSVTETMISSQDGAESESGISYKKKLQKQLFHDEIYMNLQNEKLAKRVKKRKFKEEPLEENEEKPKAKFVKSEPESDVELAKKKKRKKRDSQSNGNLNSLDAMSEESYLDMRVKEEQSKFSTPKKRKKEKISEKYNNTVQLKDTDDSGSCDDHNIQNKVNKENDDSNVFLKEEPQDLDSNKVKKKKSKKDKQNTDNCDSVIPIEKYSVDEVSVETSLETKKRKSSRKSHKKCISDNGNSLENRYVKGQTVIDTSNNVSDNEFHSFRNSMSGYSNVEDRDALQNIDKNGTYKLFNDESSSHLQENVQRIARISDRIRFEDEEHSELETAYEKETGTKLLQVDKFKKVKNLKPVSYKLPKEALISQNDEIWVLRCPQDIVTNALKGVDLTIDHKCKIKVSGLTYEGSVDIDSKSTALLTTDRGASVIKLVLVNGVVNLHRRVPKPHYVEDKVMVNNQTDFIPLPETKCRHPLFGTDYKRAIKLSESVRERLNGVVNVSGENFGKKKKRRLKKDDTDGTGHIEVEPPVKLEPQLVEVEVYEKKKKRKRNQSLSEDILTKESKKQKQDCSSAEVWESEKAIEENLFNY